MGADGPMIDAEGSVTDADGPVMDADSPCQVDVFWYVMPGNSN